MPKPSRQADHASDQSQPQQGHGAAYIPHQQRRGTDQNPHQPVTSTRPWCTFKPTPTRPRCRSIPMPAIACSLLSLGHNRTQKRMHHPPILRKKNCMLHTPTALVTSHAQPPLARTAPTHTPLMPTKRAGMRPSCTRMRGWGGRPGCCWEGSSCALECAVADAALRVVVFAAYSACAASWREAPAQADTWLYRYM